VHPCLPIINEAEFWQMYYHQSGVGAEEAGLSLFTFQAMLFAASGVCCFIPLCWEGQMSADSAYSLCHQRQSNLPGL
jgi:hypothetical protein